MLSPRRSLPGASTSMSPRNCWTQTKADGVAMTGKLDSPAREAAAPSAARRKVTVSKQKGPHPRAAVTFVNLAGQLDADVTGRQKGRKGIVRGTVGVEREIPGG